MMSGAADALQQALEQCKVNQPSNPRTIANINSEYYKSSEDVMKGLIKQLTSPILWQKCMERLIDEGIEQFYEIGPGRVLTGLMKRINRKTQVINISSSQSIHEILKH